MIKAKLRRGIPSNVGLKRPFRMTSAGEAGSLIQSTVERTIER
jgi:hypothetical protein